MRTAFREGEKDLEVCGQLVQPQIHKGIQVKNASLKRVYMELLCLELYIVVCCA